MVLRNFKIIIALCICIAFSSVETYAHTDIGEKQINVTMRMIGHEVLLCSSDSETLILAVEKDEDGRYKIEFSAEFEFVHDDLVPIISDNLKKAGITESYIVEVEECISKDIVYSYQIGGLNYPNIIPCAGRGQSMGCYKLFITLLDENNASINFAYLEKPNLNYDPLTTNSITDYTTLSYLGFPVLLLIGLFIFYLKRKDKPTIDPKLTPIGSYYFNENNMQLLHDKKVTELTSKEADLLSLLHKNSNKTLEREFILNSVWGDEGDYVGRTLDVFISKLRKKLEADTTVKIINIRGVGYKLVQKLVNALLELIF